MPGPTPRFEWDSRSARPAKAASKRFRSGGGHFLLERRSVSHANSRHASPASKSKYAFRRFQANGFQGAPIEPSEKWGNVANVYASLRVSLVRREVTSLRQRQRKPEAMLGSWKNAARSRALANRNGRLYICHWFVVAVAFSRVGATAAQNFRLPNFRAESSSAGRQVVFRPRHGNPRAPWDGKGNADVPRELPNPSPTTGTNRLPHRKGINHGHRVGARAYQWHPR